MAVPVQSRRSEKRREYQARSAPLQRKGNVVIVDGHGVRLAIHRGRLLVHDGSGSHRRERQFSRVRPPTRLVVLSGTGSLALSVLGWCRDLGVPVLVLDRDGRTLALSAPTSGDAHLRRAQAFAIENPVGLAIARYLLAEKVREQEHVLRSMCNRRDLLDDFVEAKRSVEEAASIDELLLGERGCALAFWSAWRELPVRFRPSDQGRVPEHWLTFGPRSSSLSGSPRLAVSPGNAIANYVHNLAESEARIACQVVGLDPLLAVTHADHRGRPSLALDVQEIARGHVEGYVLDLLKTRTFRATDFFETRRGVCRVLSPLTHELAETLPRWAELLGPVAERVAAMLAEAPGSRIDRVPTPLTSESRKQANADRRRPRAARPTPPPALCKLCHRPLPKADRVYCNRCLALPQSERYASTLGLDPGDGLAPPARPSASLSPTAPRTKRRCRRCGEQVSHRKRVLCDSCYVTFRQELAAQRRACKECGQPVPHRKRALCDDCLAERAVRGRERPGRRPAPAAPC
jgi:CRISPR-associated endonuclease Cas1